MPSPSKKIAIFDFDGTLIRGDSLPLYLVEVAGYWRVAVAFVRAVMGSLSCDKTDQNPDRRTAIKRIWLRSLLAGVPCSAARAAAERLSGRITWRRDLVERLLWHKSQGHDILVATGALDCYIHVLLRDLPVDVVMATVAGIDNAGGEERLTGELVGANSVRAAKAERISQWLLAHGPYAESWGYGNAPHDLPMLALCTHKKVV